MNFIKREDCKHGYTYRIHSRNLVVGVFNEKLSGFVGIREKFGDHFLFIEFHHDNGPPFGTVRPLREIEKCPVEDIRDHLDTICCECEKKANWIPDTPEELHGEWRHTELTDCTKAQPVAPRNKPLFDYLAPLEIKVKREILIEDLEESISHPKQFWGLNWMARSALNLGVMTESELSDCVGVKVTALDQWLLGVSEPEKTVVDQLKKIILEKAKSAPEIDPEAVFSRERKASRF